MTDTVDPAKNYSKIALLSALGLGLFLSIGFTIYSAICPCERTPGGFLFGESAPEPVQDWRFANSVALCQLQIYAGIRPHSINLNCMSTPEGDLYLSCSGCENKYWASKVGNNENAIMRLDGILYPVLLNREVDPEKLDNAWRARVSKLQTFGGAPVNPVPDAQAIRPDHWWSFHVTSSS